MNPIFRSCNSRLAHLHHSSSSRSFRLRAIAIRVREHSGIASKNTSTWATIAQRSTWNYTSGAAVSTQATAIRPARGISTARANRRGVNGRVWRHCWGIWRHGGWIWGNGWSVWRYRGRVWGWRVWRQGRRIGWQDRSNSVPAATVTTSGSCPVSTVARTVAAAWTRILSAKPGVMNDFKKSAKKPFWAVSVTSWTGWSLDAICFVTLTCFSSPAFKLP